MIVTSSVKVTDFDEVGAILRLALPLGRYAGLDPSRVGNDITIPAGGKYLVPLGKTRLVQVEVLQDIVLVNAARNCELTMAARQSSEVRVIGPTSSPSSTPIDISVDCESSVPGDAVSIGTDVAGTLTAAELVVLGSVSNFTVLGPFQLTASGFATLGQLTIQWGTGTAGAPTTPATIAFPTAFSSAALSVVAVGTTAVALAVTALTATTFDIEAGVGTPTFFYIAVGPT